MSFAFNDLAGAREALRKVAAASRTSLTAASDAAGIARGSITRFTSGRGQRQNDQPDIYLSSILKMIDYLGYELVIRKKTAGNSRTRLFAAVRDENTGERAS